MTGVSRSGPKKEGFIKFHRTFKFVLKLLNRCDPNISEVALKAYFQKVIDNSRRRYEDWNKQTPKRASTSKHYSTGLSKRQKIAEKIAKKMEGSDEGGSEEEMSNEEQSNAGEEKPSFGAERKLIESEPPEASEEVFTNTLNKFAPIDGDMFIVEIDKNTDEISDEDEVDSIFEPTIAIAANIASDVAAKVAAKVSADAARNFGLMVIVKPLPSL